MKLGSLALLALCLSLATADIFKAGMSVVTGVNNPLTQEDLFKEGVLPFMFMKLDTLEVKEFNFDGGKLTNLNIVVHPPKDFKDVKVSIFSDTLYLKIGGIGVDIDADFEVQVKGKTESGHCVIVIGDLGVQIKMKDQPVNNQKVNALGSEVDLDLSKTHTTLKVIAEGNVEEIKNALFSLVGKQVVNTFDSSNGSWIPDWGKAFTFHIGGTIFDPISETLQDKAQSIVNEFVSSIPNYDITQFNFKKDLTNAQYKIQEKNEYLVNYAQSIFPSSKQRSIVKDALMSNFNFINYKNDKYLNLDKSLHNKIQHAQHDINDDKIHYLIAPELFSKVFFSGSPLTASGPTLDSDILANLLDKNLDSKVEKYFGDKVKFSCKPTQDEPKLIGKNKQIVGTYVIRCTLDTIKPSEEPLYEIDINFEFTINPEVTKDGKSLKAKFGEFQSTDFDFDSKGRAQVNTRISDKPMTNFLFPGFGGLFGGLSGYDDDDDFDKFLESLNFDNGDMMESLFGPQDDLLLFPFPMGFGFSDANMNINSNGVIDVSGDMKFDASG